MREMLYILAFYSIACALERISKEREPMGYMCILRDFFPQRIGSLTMESGKFEIHTAEKSKIFKIGQ